MSRRTRLTEEKWEELFQVWVNADCPRELDDAIGLLLDEAVSAREAELSLMESIEKEPQYHCETCRCGTEDWEDGYHDYPY